ncbi:hypothetical protein FA13DRAFT_1807875 [Coprinellus micaceus]|uniref:Uncharacterized protein n=1 Tax=Coprinellus micaceus TaxID=71717 RepID=A0A4Y7R4B3_COPMI|nr:hypothetical protein FA13DRAFT_1807875 [Coprinellus micaceus]
MSIKPSKMPVNPIPDGGFTFRYPVLPSNARSSPPLPSDVSMDVPSDPAGNIIPEKDIPFTKIVKDTLELIETDLDFEMLRLSLCGVTDEAALKIVHDHLSKSPFCRVRRFYGNIVGISPRIMASGSLTLDTTPSWEHSLPNDVHVTHSWVEQEGTRTELVHTMSNLRVGTFSKDSFLYILLPRLSSSAHTPQGLTSRQFRDVWDLAIGLAAEAINENDSTFTIRSQDLERFSRLVRSIADENHLDWFQDFSFVHVVRGKSSPHYFDAESRCDALIKYLVRHNMSILDIARDEDTGGHWFVDTGLMITHQEKSVVWSTSAHAAVIRSLFGVDYSDDQYERELFSHLTDASCARVRCHEAASVDPTRPKYIELTVNDEVFQATDERGVPLERITALHFVRRPARHSTPLDLLFHDYADKDTKISSVVSATMRIHDCLEVLTDFDPQVLFESCLVFKPRDIWWWRALRVYALDLVIELQRRDGRGLSVLGQDAQLLTAAVPWLVSSLHRGVIDPLSNGRLPFPASSTRGAIFLHDIELPNLDLDGEIPFFKDLSPVYYMEEEALVRYLGASVGTIVHSLVHPDLPIVPNHAREQPSPNGPREFAFTIFSLQSHFEGLLLPPSTHRLRTSRLG